MRFFTAKVGESQDLGGAYTWLSLDGCEPLAGASPGQFVMLRGWAGNDPLLPRAYSVLWVEGGRAELLIRRVGRGSGLLAAARPGDPIEVRGPLGRGFPEAEPGVTELLVAGGCGLAPLYLAARRALAEGRPVRLLYGARQSCDLVLIDLLRAHGIDHRIATEDGSAGEQGLVTRLLARTLAGGSRGVRILACGPEGMLRETREVARFHRVPCYLSLEAPMACGMGACLGCAVPARDRSRFLYVCKDGPVFPAEEVWP
jgi:dihydroorotate dehydrogenase electron transfer subunit